VWTDSACCAITNSDAVNCNCNPLPACLSLSPSKGGSSAFFKNLTVGEQGCVLKPGNLVKLRISTTGKGGGKYSPITYGSITGFEIPDGVEAGEVTC
jgi:hypothetical protein